MEGGVPAGTNIRPGELGCFITRIRIRITTKLGKRSKKPKGIDMDEFPFSLIRLRKKESLGSVLDFSFFHSSAAGAVEIAGRRLTSRCTKPILRNDRPGAPNAGGLIFWGGTLLTDLSRRHAIGTRHGIKRVVFESSSYVVCSRSLFPKGCKVDKGRR